MAFKHIIFVKHDFCVLENPLEVLATTTNVDPGV